MYDRDNEKHVIAAMKQSIPLRKRHLGINSLLNRAEVEQSTKARIERIESMDEALYDDKLAGVIIQERYETKHESFMNEIETLELAMASFDSGVRA